MNHRVLAAAAAAAGRYLENLPGARVFPRAADVERLAKLDEPLPESGSDALEVLRLLESLGSPAAVASAGPRYFGFVVGGCLPAALAAHWLNAAWDQPTIFEAASPLGARIEKVALAWLLELLDLPRDCGGGFVTGATMANFCALAAARHRLLQRVGWDVESDGLFGAPPITVVVPDEVHPSVTKALGMLGLGRDRLVRVPVDEQGRMCVDRLPTISDPTVVCVQAGNVNSGASDPIAAVCDRVEGTGAWVHVDGAFGLWAAASPILCRQVAGAERADSWATDAHKWLNVPYDSGVVLVRDEQSLRRAMAVTADYLPGGTGRDPADYTPELSRRARGVEIWAAIKSLGRAGVAELVEGCCAHARRFGDGLRGAGFRVLNDVVLNQVLVSFGDAATTRAVIQAVQTEGTCWAGPTVWQGQTAMRISISNWSTSAEDVERSLRAVIRAAQDVARQGRADAAN